jgi:hypothetical protein
MTNNFWLYKIKHLLKSDNQLSWRYITAEPNYNMNHLPSIFHSSSYYNNRTKQCNCNKNESPKNKTGFSAYSNIGQRVSERKGTIQLLQDLKATKPRLLAQLA